MIIHDPDRAAEIARAFAILTKADLTPDDRRELYELVLAWIDHAPEARKLLADTFREIETLFRLRWEANIARALNSKFKDLP
jgi:hypothetical protein